MSLPKEAFHQRSYFYVGGEYVKTAGGQHVFENQMYVERLLPADVTKPYPIIFIHGGAQTGTVRHSSYLLLNIQLTQHRIG